MRPEVRDLLQELQRRIPELVRPHIRRLILFGSAAREEARLESDVDVLVLLDEKSQEVEEALREAAYQVMWACDFRRILSLKILSRKPTAVRTAHATPIKDTQREVIGFERLYFKPKTASQELGVVLQTAKA